MNSSSSTKLIYSHIIFKQGTRIAYLVRRLREGACALFCWLVLAVHIPRVLTTIRTCVLTKHVLSVFPVSVKKELHIQENGSSTLHSNPH